MFLLIKYIKDVLTLQGCPYTTGEIVYSFLGGNKYDID